MLEVIVADVAPPGVVAVGVPVLATGGDRGADGAEVAPGIESLTRLDRLDEHTSRLAAALLPDDADAGWLKQQGFDGRPGQALVLRSAAGAPSVVLLGLGDRRGVGAERWRRASAALVRAAGQGGVAALLVPSDAPG